MNSEQEAAWRGDFGNDYNERNSDPLFHARVNLWSKILKDIQPKSIVEIGAGQGANLLAIKELTDSPLLAIEPNEMARLNISKEIVVRDGFADSIPLKENFAELIFTCGVLIHIHPDELGKVCDEIYRVSSKYIVCIEYFSAEPESKPYRGHNDLLFKRDFGSYWLDRFPNLAVIDYGFSWKRSTGLDNLTYWLFSK